MDFIQNSINEIISEIDSPSQIIGVYAGGFKPPTKGHFDVVIESLKKYPKINKFIIFVGSKERNGITQDQSLIIWDIYKKYLPFKVEIKDSKIPVTDVYQLSKDNPNDTILWFIGAREGKEEDFKDFASRTKASVNYPNIKPIHIVLKSEISGTGFRQALKAHDLNTVKKMVPSQLTDDEVETIINTLSSSINEEQLNRKKPLLEKINIIDIISKNIKKIISVIKTESNETKKAFQLITKSIKENRKLTKEEIDFCFNQLKDVFKTVGLGAIAALPGSIVILGLIKVLKLQKHFYPSSIALNENYTFNENINCEEYINELLDHYKQLYPEIETWPDIEYIDDEDNAKDFFGKTAYYDPNNLTVALYINGRHPKDIVRSFSHELIHHIQKMENRLNNYTTTNVNEDDHLEKIEKEAYEKGNIIFRKWENNLKKEK